MPTTDALGLALSGLDVTKARIDTLSRNIANAQTDGYTEKTQGQTTGLVGNAEVVPVQRNVDAFLQNSLNQTGGNVNQLAVSVNLLQNIETSFGTPNADTSLAASITNLQNAFQNLSVNPEQSSLFTSVINAGTSVARNLNSLSQTVTTTQTSAQLQVQQTVVAVNQILQNINSTNQQVTAHAGNEDVTDQEDQRDRLIGQLSGNLDITTFTEPNGAIAVYTKDGKPLVVDNVVATFGVGGPTGVTWTEPGSSASPAPVAIHSGTLGGLLTLQNTTLPGIQAQLDDIGRGLTVEFNTINVPLFNDGGTNALNSPAPTAAPATETNAADPLQVTGYASRIAVNQAVIANPLILHDGAVPPALTVAAPPLAPGDTTVINNALTLFNRTNIAFNAAVGLPANASFVQAATDFVTAQGGLRANAQGQLDSEKALQQTITNKISAQSGVNVDNEVALLSVLQNAYAANARVLTTVQNLFDKLFTAIQ
jgi:flagellar hook-associated protein 1 FlgK